jgi:hypothetical protein
MIHIYKLLRHVYKFMIWYIFTCFKYIFMNFSGIYRKTSPHMVMVSLADIQDQDNCRKKVIHLQDFLQGPCSYGLRKLWNCPCLQYCTLNSHPVLHIVFDYKQKSSKVIVISGDLFLKTCRVLRKSKICPCIASSLLIVPSLRHTYTYWYTKEREEIMTRKAKCRLERKLLYENHNESFWTGHCEWSDFPRNRL